MVGGGRAHIIGRQDMLYNANARTGRRAVAAAIVVCTALAATAAFLTAAMPTTAKASGTVASSTEDVGLDVEALQGSLTDFRGAYTQYHDGLWLLDNAQGTSIVEATDELLTIYFPGDQPETVATIHVGTAKNFVAHFDVQDDDNCGGCEPSAGQSCCNTHCASGSDEWCICTANATCYGQGGVKRVRLVEGCEFWCVGADDPQD